MNNRALAMLERKVSNAADEEKKLVEAIQSSPAARAPFIELAQFLERCELHDESKIVYRGNLPGSLQERHQLDPYPRSHSANMDSCTRLCWYGAEQYSLNPPLNVDAKRNSIFHETVIKTAPEHVDIMRNCTLLYDGKNELYLDDQGIRNTEYSSVNSYLLIPQSQSHAQRTQISGLSIMLSGHMAHNFYHWHYDQLIALSLIQAAGIDLTDIDNILIDKRLTGFQVGMLILAGIKEEQITFIDTQNCHVHCEQMLMVRMHNRQGMAQSRRHLDWIRQTYLPGTSIVKKVDSGTHPTRVAIVRKARGFSNAAQVYSRLQQHGYSCVELENLPYLEQVSLFAEASSIVSPHGAGLSLLAYCKPGTVVHEFYADHVQPCFWSISSSLGLKYHNYNCSDITDKAITTSNKNLAERLAKTVNVSDEQLTSVLGEPTA